MADVLVAGIGNIFLRDDGFGSAVATHLDGVPIPKGARIVDYGIRGLHLSYDLLDGVAALIVIDAVPAPGGSDARPGTVLTMEVDPDGVGDAQTDAHSLSPAAVLARVQVLGGRLPPTWVVGCVPADLEEGIGLSDIVAQAVPHGAAAVLKLVDKLLKEPAGMAHERTGEY